MTESIIILLDPGPEVLYRYRSVDGDNLEYLRRTLLEDEVFLALPSTLNDPFDCRINFECKKRSNKEVRDVIDRNLRLMEPDLSRTERRRRVKHDMKLGFFKQSDYWKEMTAEMQADIERRGVLCLTESPDSLLMWAHYASGHRGVCLKFRHVGNHFFGRAQKVRYSDEPRTIDPFDGSLVGLQITLLLITKSTNWAYEKEWRIVDYKAGSGVQKFSPELLCGVILGVKIGQKEREQICTWVRMRSHPTELFHAREHQGELIIEHEL